MLIGLLVSGRPVHVKHDAQMHHGQHMGKQKEHKLNENRRKFRIFDEIGGNL